MKIKAKQTKIKPGQMVSSGMDINISHEWQVTIDKEYIVVAIEMLINSIAYGNTVLYEIVDDYGRLIPAPACLFEIIDGSPSKHWRAKYSNDSFVFSPIEFYQNPYLSEELLDREKEAIEIFNLSLK